MSAAVTPVPEIAAQLLRSHDRDKALIADASASPLDRAWRYLLQKQDRYTAARTTYRRLVGQYAVPGEVLDLSRIPCALAARSALEHDELMYRTATEDFVAELLKTSIPPAP